MLKSTRWRARVKGNKMRVLYLSILAVSALVACDSQIEPSAIEADPSPSIIDDVQTAQPIEQAEPETAPQVASNIAETKLATIDWNAARADFAARETDDGALAQVASGGAPVVPILLPEQPIGIASNQGAAAFQFRPTADGYFAVQKGDVYDLIINGTDRLIAAADGDGSAVDSPLVFEETMTGAQVSFSRYGASYLVEFMCRERQAVLDGTCINETTALDEVEKLLIAGTR